MSISIISFYTYKKEAVYGVVTAGYRHKPEIEVIVVDNGSTDNTAYWMEQLVNHYSFDDLQRKREGKNFIMAHGKYIPENVFLLSDTNISRIREKDLSFISKDIREICLQTEAYISLYFQSNSNLSNWSGSRKTGNESIRYFSFNGFEHSSKRLSAKALSATEKFVFDGHKMSITLLSDTDLIATRVEGRTEGNYTSVSILETRDELKHKLKKINEKMNEMQLF